MDVITIKKVLYMEGAFITIVITSFETSLVKTDRFKGRYND